jgi:tetratricopeptide (TPR) repeat protein
VATAMDRGEKLEQKLAGGLRQVQDLRLQGGWNEALELLDELAPGFEKAGGAWPARRWLATARVLTDQSLFAGEDTYNRRQEALDRALQEAQDVGESTLLGEVWDARGLSLHVSYLTGDRSREPEGELASFQRGLELRRAVGDSRGEAESLFHLGLYYSIVRQDENRARPHFEQALDMFRTNADRLGESYAVRHLAIGRYLEGDLEGARQGLAESLRLREEIGFTPGVAMALKTLGSLYAEMGEKAKALDTLERARESFASLGADRRADWVQKEIDEVRREVG